MTSYAPDPSKVIGLPSPIVAPKVQSSNMTSSMVDSMETVVTSNTNENIDVIKNVCNNNTEDNSPIYPTIESQWPPNLQRFLKRMWYIDPHHRPLMKEIFEFCDKNHKLSFSEAHE